MSSEQSDGQVNMSSREETNTDTQTKLRTDKSIPLDALQTDS